MPLRFPRYGWLHFNAGRGIPSARPVETWTRSVVAQLGDPVLVEPEVVRELVEDGDPDLLAELLRVGKALLERDPVDVLDVGHADDAVEALQPARDVLDRVVVVEVRELVAAHSYRYECVEAIYDAGSAEPDEEFGLDPY